MIRPHIGWHKNESKNSNYTIFVARRSEIESSQEFSRKGHFYGLFCFDFKKKLNESQGEYIYSDFCQKGTPIIFGHIILQVSVGPYFKKETDLLELSLGRLKEYVFSSRAT